MTYPMLVSCDSYTVKTKNEKSTAVASFETIVANGLARCIDSSIESMVMQNFDVDPDCTVCPRLVHSMNISIVKVCNTLAKFITVKPRTDIFQINEPKVIDNLVNQGHLNKQDFSSKSPEDL